jgi:hypothetical protein
MLVMPQGVPFLNKNCPFGYSVDSSTGLCTLFNPITVGGIALGAIALGFGVGTVLAHRRVHPNPSLAREAVIAGSGLGAGLLVGLVTRAALAPAQPASSAQPISDKVVQARLVKTSRREQRAHEPMQFAMVKTAAPVTPCEAGCICVSTTPEWCTTAQRFIRPNDVADLVSFVQPSAVPPQYDFVANVAQWIGFFSYASDPEGDTWCPPLHTLSARSGDCEDLSLLVTSVLVAGHVTTNLVVGTVHDPRGDFGHAWVEGSDAQGFFLIEATNGKLYRGQRPAMYDPTLTVRAGGICFWGAS